MTTTNKPDTLEAILADASKLREESRNYWDKVRTCKKKQDRNRYASWAAAADRQADALERVLNFVSQQVNNTK